MANLKAISSSATLTQTSHWFGQEPGGRNITYKDFFFNFDVYIREFLCSQESQNPL